MYVYICRYIYVYLLIFLSIYLRFISSFLELFPRPHNPFSPFSLPFSTPAYPPSLSLRFPIQGETIPIRDYANIWLNTELQGKEGYLSIFLRKKSTKMIVLNFKLFFMIISKYFFVIPAILNPTNTPPFFLKSPWGIYIHLFLWSEKLQKLGKGGGGVWW